MTVPSPIVPDPIPVATHAPPLPPARIPRRVWIGGAIVAGLLLMLLCAGAGAGVYWKVAAPAANTAKFVGKWEIDKSQAFFASHFLVLQLNANGSGEIAFAKDDKSINVRWKNQGERILLFESELPTWLADYDPKNDTLSFEGLPLKREK